MIEKEKFEIILRGNTGFGMRWQTILSNSNFIASQIRIHESESAALSMKNIRVLFNVTLHLLLGHLKA